MVVEGGAKVDDVDDQGNSPVLLAVMNGHLQTLQFLLEHTGTGIANSTWVMLNIYLLRLGPENDTAVVDSLLRCMLLQSAPPASHRLMSFLRREHVPVMRESARLRAGLPAYLAQRRALLAEHSPLISPLRDIIHGYEKPSTTEEIWATGLGADP